MTQPSITSTDSFRLRAQRSELRRVAIMLGVLMVLMVIVSLRHFMDGAILGSGRAFLSTLIVVGLVAAHEFVMLAIISRANRESRLVAEYRWHLNAFIELAAPLGLMTLMHLSSPIGEVSALSAPGLLVLPLIIMLSILRLRPKFTLWTGLVAGLAHMALTIHAVLDVRPSLHQYPVLFAYSLLLMVTGVTAAIVAVEVKKYVRQAVDEATASEAARQRVEMMERDLSIARDIQRGLIPARPPALHGFDIAGFNRPADLTGGDYYDWQKLPDGRVAVALADVTGHGIGPALVMAVCRAYARASVPITPVPHLLLQRLNNLIHEDVGHGRFITFAIAIFDAAKSTMELLSAGHGPILLFRSADRSIQRYNGDGAPLGVLPDGEFQVAHAVGLEPGDVLLLITDGFFEWQRPQDKQPFGIERIEQLLIEHASANAADILDRLDAAVREFCSGNPQNDDMTAVVVKRV